MRCSPNAKLYEGLVCARHGLKQLITRHPFDSDVGIARLVAYLGDRDPELYSYAVSATASIPFVNTSARETLMVSADQHPDALVRLEAAWALTRTGSEFGRQRLARLCLDPRYSTCHPLSGRAWTWRTHSIKSAGSRFSSGGGDVQLANASQ